MWRYTRIDEFYYLINQVFLLAGGSVSPDLNHVSPDTFSDGFLFSRINSFVKFFFGK